MATKKPAVEYTKIPDAIAGITAALDKSNGQVSDDRLHSVESHLRKVIGLLGYKPRETPDKKATVSDLAKQVATCLKAEEGKVSEGTAQIIQMQLHSVHSNLVADAGTPATPKLKEVPEETAPARPTGDPKSEFSAKTVDELKLIAKEYQVEIAPDAKKADIVTAILKKAGYTVTLFLIGLFLSLFAPRAQAFENFGVTNAFGGAASALLINFPTNSASTNLSITGYTTNGAVITTNGYYPNQLTGGPIWVKNYSPDGVGFFSTATSYTNISTIWTVKLVRAWTDHVPISNPPNTNEWEQTPGITLTWTQTGPGQYVFGTNLDQYQLGNCTYLGVYWISNSAFGSTNLDMTNIVMGLEKNAKPRALIPGNF